MIQKILAFFTLAFCRVRDAWAAFVRFLQPALSAVARVARPVGRVIAWVWDKVYRYHYQLGVFVLRKARRVYRFVGRTTRRPRRFLRYAWIAVLYRPVHRFLHRMWRLLIGLPCAAVRQWKKMKKNLLNLLLWVPRSVWHWFADYREEWFTLGRFLGPIVGAVVLTTTIRSWTETRFCLVLSYRGTELGVIESASVYDKGAAMARERVSNIDNSFTVDAVPTLTMVIRGAKSPMTASQVCDAILTLSAKDIQEATALYIDDELMGVVADKEGLQTMLEEIKDSMSGDEEVPGQRVEFVQDVRMEDGLYPQKTLKDLEEIRERLVSEETVKDEYIVQKGDVFSKIAAAHGLTEEQLQMLNPEVTNVNKIQIGQVLVVQRPTYFLQVVVVKTVKVEGVMVDYNTRTVKRDDKYTDWSNVKTKGVEGEKTQVYDVIMLDGYEISRVLVEEIITKEPVTKVVEVGTKKRPTSGNSGQGDGITTGKWVWPVPICHNVYQGYSSGHKAIDISPGPVPVRGKPAVAADGGVVIQAATGWNGGYGTVVKIQHSNGLITVYAHLDSLSVKVGQKVSAGQTVGLIGNTGRSFGPHLHFEVIKNGVKVNPLNYVKP